jgi:hypothetical protein
MSSVKAEVNQSTSSGIRADISRNNTACGEKKRGLR